MSDWSEDTTLCFLEAYQNEPCIWNSKDINHKNRQKVLDAWKRINVIINKNVKELKNKKEILMATFRRHFKKKQDSIRSGAGADDIYRPIWFAYDLMESFLGPVYTSKNNINTEKKPRPKKCAIVEEIEKDTSEDEDQDDGQIHLIVKEETDIEQTPPKLTLSSKPRLRRVVKRRIVKHNTERHNIVERKIIKRSEYSKKDECDTFGEYISVSLRKHDERTRSMIKQAINNILFEQEMKKYNGGQHYTVVLSEMDDPNPLILGDECEK